MKTILRNIVGGIVLAFAFTVFMAFCIFYFKCAP